MTSAWISWMFCVAIIALFSAALCNGQAACLSNQFRCASNGKCIASNRQCDKTNDCDDGSDEKDCDCRADQFACYINGQCIPSNRVCDGVFHCTDKTDESNCRCNPDQFKCKGDGLCIPNRFICNRINDCEGNSDEADCECKANQFACVSSGKCVASTKRCDQNVDCADGSDEKGCPPSPIVKSTKCWECQNYDANGNYYDQCPMYGDVDPVRAYIGNCTGKCFTHTDDRDAKWIFRGCTSSQWGLPDPLPEDGCYKWYSEVWCVCSQHGCNGGGLGNVTSNKQFDWQVDYRKKGSNSASTLGRRFVGLPLLAAVATVILSTRGILAPLK